MDRCDPGVANGFQTYGEDFEIDKPKMEFTIKLKRPQGQYSVYDNHPKDPGAPPKPDARHRVAARSGKNRTRAGSGAANFV